MFIFTQIKAVFIVSALLVFVLLPTCLLAVFFPLKRRLKIVSPVWMFCQRIVLRYALEARILVREDHRTQRVKGIPPYGLYVANHQSFVDIPLITVMYPAPPIMKKEVMYIPLVGWLGWLSGAMPVARGKRTSGKKVFEETRKRMVDGKIAVQVYPEGTRSIDANPKPVNKIKKTLLVFAYNEKIPVIPTSIYGTRAVLSSRGRIHTKRPLGIIVHKEVDPNDFSSAEEFYHFCWGKVIEGHSQMKAQLSHLDKN